MTEKTPQIIEQKENDLPILEGKTSNGRELAIDGQATVQHDIYYTQWGHERNKFILLPIIADIHYELELIESYGSKSTYSLNLKTKEYEYATVSIGKEGRDALGIALKKFIESITNDGRWPINKIEIVTADADYAPSDIERCREEIRNHPNNTLTPKALSDIKSARELFDLYHHITRKQFEANSSFKKASARARLFKAIIRKALPDWEIEEVTLASGHHFCLRKRPE